jgi:RNA polymerase-binding transcription factor DksA
MTMPGAAPRLPAHLSAESVALLRALLLCQLAEYADQVAQGRATVDDLTGPFDSESLRERELAEATALHAAAVVQEARSALNRLDDGTYGICEACGRAIPFERLEAIPHARRCVACPPAPAGLRG